MPRAETVPADRTRKRTTIVHPLLFAVFPVLFLFARNKQQFSLDVMLIPMTVLLAGTVVCWVVLGLILRDRQRSALIVSLFLLLLFSFQTAFRLVPHFRFVLAGMAVERTKTVFLVWVILFVLGGWFLTRTRRDPSTLTRIVNVAAAALVLMSVLDIAFYELGGRMRSSSPDDAHSSEALVVTPEQTDTFPDIYYLIFDAYGREDVLREIHGHDNRPFLDALRKRGFYIAERSTANYAFTGMSLSSALNMNHLSELLPGADEDSTDLLPLLDLIQHSRLVKFLRRRGYKTIAFSTGYFLTEMTTADRYLQTAGFGDEFLNGLSDMTPVPVILHRLDPGEEKRTRILGVFDGLQRLVGEQSPKFVFAHLLVPRKPFVFGPNGEEIYPAYVNDIMHNKIGYRGAAAEGYKRHYRGQVIYVNSKIIEIVDEILAGSRRPPIIVIQGDHGPRVTFVRRYPTDEALREKFPILNAYHLPGDGSKRLYPDITPVNSFRMILNHTFGTNFERVADECFYANIDLPYKRGNVTDIVRPGAAGGDSE